MNEKFSAVISALVVVVFGLALTPTVRSFVSDAQENATSSESSLLSLVTIMWIIGIVVLAAGIAYLGFKKG